MGDASFINSLFSKPEPTSHYHEPTKKQAQRDMKMMLTAAEWDLFWIVWMLVFCAANGAAVVSCVAFLIAHYHRNEKNEMSTDNKARPTTTTAHTPSSWASNASALEFQDPLSVCGKRKARDEALGMTSALSQGKWKQQRRRIVVARATFQSTNTTHTTPTNTTPSNRFTRARAFSFGEATTLLRGGTAGKQFAPLRRVVSCGNMDTNPQGLRSAANDLLSRFEPTLVQSQKTTRPEANERSLMADLKSQLWSFLIEKLRTAARNTVDEVLTSVFSFLTYAMLLFLVRQYSAVAIGVSLDLGAFSIEL